MGDPLIHKTPRRRVAARMPLLLLHRAPGLSSSLSCRSSFFFFLASRRGAVARAPLLFFFLLFLSSKSCRLFLPLPLHLPNHHLYKKTPARGLRAPNRSPVRKGGLSGKSAAHGDPLVRVVHRLPGGIVPHLLVLLHRVLEPLVQGLQDLDHGLEPLEVVLSG